MLKRTFPCIMRYHKGSRLKAPEQCYFTLLQLYMPWRNESNLQQGFSSYEENFKHIETEILPNISHHNCFYGVYDDEDLMNITWVNCMKLVRVPSVTKQILNIEFHNCD